ncbi:MAG: NADH-quinone oxidoreductase subunit NuoN [Gammaproteobacteria bacterium]
MGADFHLLRADTEVFVFAAACAALLGDLFLPRRWRGVLHWGVVVACFVAAFVAWRGFDDAPVLALNGLFMANPLTALMKAAVMLAVGGSLFFSRRYLADAKMNCGEYYALSLTAALGMLVIVSAAHLLPLYIGLELMSLSLYAMIAIDRENMRAAESAIKYFVLGALASGLFLYGVSVIYGATGELGIAEIAAAIARDGGEARLALSLGLVFMLAGLAFKLGAAPFHMWLPDVYQGAPAPVVLFVAAAPKIAATAMMLRVLTEALWLMEADWRQMLAVLAVASLAVGNITAIAQSNLKRMLAYSAIAHSGFIILGILAGGDEGSSAAVFYVIIYALMTIGGFGALTLLAEGGRERAELADIKGLAANNGAAAAVLLILMFSMAGVPPFAGFAAKLAVLQAVLAAELQALAVIAVLLSAVGAFYYLRVVKLMYFDAPEQGGQTLPKLPLPAQLSLAAAGALVLLLGMFPGPLLAVCASAARLF